MDKVFKFLSKLSKKEREAFLMLIQKVKEDHLQVPGLRKLVGKENLYRARLGRYRIIFHIEGALVEVVRITKRDDQTYKNL